MLSCLLACRSRPCHLSSLIFSFSFSLSAFLRCSFMFGPMISVSGLLTDRHDGSGYSRDRLVSSSSINLCTSFIGDVCPFPTTPSANCCTALIRRGIHMLTKLHCHLDLPNLYSRAMEHNPCWPYSLIIIIIIIIIIVTYNPRLACLVSKAPGPNLGDLVLKSSLD